MSKLKLTILGILFVLSTHTCSKDKSHKSKTDTNRFEIESLLDGNGDHTDGTCSTSATDDDEKHCRSQHVNNGDDENRYGKRSNRHAKWLKLIEEANNYSQNESNKMSYSSVIEQDLRPFTKTGITEEMIRKALNRGVFYQVRGHKLFRSKDCNFPSRCAGVEHFLLKIINELEDMEMVINVSDWPQINSFVRDPIPVFSFSKTGDYLDIMFPAWTFWEGGPAISIYPTGIGRWDLLRKQLIKASRQIPWHKKQSNAFFRGSRTSAERDPLILLSREHSDLVDAQYTKNQAWKSDQDTLGVPAAKEVSFEDHCGYKYLFNYRGVAASFRFKHLFLCKSLVFQVGDQWLEFFYPLSKPWFHYIPVSSSATKDDIRELIEFAKTYDDKVKEIAINGFNWIKDNLRMEDVNEYWKQLLTSYRKLIKYKIKENPHLMQIS